MIIFRLVCGTNMTRGHNHDEALSITRLNTLNDDTGKYLVLYLKLRGAYVAPYSTPPHKWKLPLVANSRDGGFGSSQSSHE